MEGSEAAGGMGIISLVYIAVMLLMIISMWKVFSKAGKPGWASIVPIYNIIVMCEIAGKPAWWFILLFIPVVGFIVSIILLLEIVKKFGKGGGFVAGLILLPMIFWPMLAFGSAEYEG